MSGKLLQQTLIQFLQDCRIAFKSHRDKWFIKRSLTKLGSPLLVCSSTARGAGGGTSRAQRRAAGPAHGSASPGGGWERSERVFQTGKQHNWPGTRFLFCPHCMTSLLFIFGFPGPSAPRVTAGQQPCPVPAAGSLGRAAGPRPALPPAPSTRALSELGQGPRADCPAARPAAPARSSASANANQQNSTRATWFRLTHTWILLQQLQSTPKMNGHCTHRFSTGGSPDSWPRRPAPTQRITGRFCSGRGRVRAALVNINFVC